MTGPCEAFESRLHALADGELDGAAAAEVRGHLLGCPACAGELEAIRALGAAIRERAPRHAASDALRARLQSAAPGASDGVSGMAEDVDPPDAGTRGVPVIPLGGRARRPAPRRWLAAAAAVAVLLAGVARVSWSGGAAAARRDLVAQAVLASHVRSLIGTHLTDVASTDQHTVKPWFDGRVDFAPPVNDLEDQGFPLLGGRLDYLDGREVAALVYGRRRHFINLFVWPVEGEGASAARWETRRGYHLATWDDGGIRHWAVSDLSRGEMERFVALLRRRENPAAPAATGH